MTDTEMIDFLEEVHKSNDFSTQCTMRQSTTGRGWRLHSSDEGSWDGAPTVREAIEKFKRQTK